jgi:hypothetical protein
MVNYLYDYDLYDHDSIENNRKAIVRGALFVRSPDIDALTQRPA